MSDTFTEGVGDATEGQQGTPDPNEGAEGQQDAQEGAESAAQGDAGQQQGIPEWDVSAPSPEIVSAAWSAMEDTDPEAAATLKAEWGDGAAANMGFARAAVEAFGDAKFIRALDEAGLSDDPAIYRIAAQVGRRLARVPGDPTTIEGVASMSDATKEQLREKMADLTTKIHDAYDKGDSRTVDKLSRERDAVSQKLSPGPIVGRELRTI